MKTPAPPAGHPRQPVDATSRASSPPSTSSSATARMRLFREMLPRRGRAGLPAPLRPADRRRGPQRRAVRPRPLRHRLAAHRGHPHARPALRAQALPDRHAAQRLRRELLGPAGAARQPALRPRHPARPRAARNAVMVRRLKSELPPHWDGTPRFPKRQLHAIEVAYTDDERQAHRWLQAYTRLRHDAASSAGRAHRDRVRAEAAQEAPLLLAGGLCSHAGAASPHRCGRGRGQPRGVRAAAAPGHPAQHDRQRRGGLRRRRRAYDEADRCRIADGQPSLPAARRRGAALAGPDERAGPSGRDAGRQQGQAADRLAARRSVKPRRRWSDNRVIVFTEYRDTQKWLQTLLAAEGLSQGGPAADPLRRHADRGARAHQGRVPGRPRTSARCASCWPPTPPPRASTCNCTAIASSTTRSPGIPTAWSSATAASTATARRQPPQVYHFAPAATTSGPSRLARRWASWRATWSS